MIYKEEKKNLFKVSSDYYLAHCISDDFTFKTGIAKDFEQTYDLKRQLKLIYPNGYKRAGCVRVGRVFNLITKLKCFEKLTESLGESTIDIESTEESPGIKCFKKPTYESLEKSLIEMKAIAEGLDINKIAMPKIGCGFDELDWETVRELLNKVFSDTEIEILVCFI